jgi:DNA-binding MarR family transcriptional regulator
MNSTSIESKDQTGDIFAGAGLDMLEGTMSYYVRLLNLHLARFLEQHLEGTPLAGGTGKVTTLILAHSRPGITAAEIAPFACKDAPAMTRLIDRLVNEGLLYRKEDPSSRRRQLLFVTEKGRALVERVRQVTEVEREWIFGMISEREYDQAIGVLRKVVASHVGGSRFGYGPSRPLSGARPPGLPVSEEY